MNGLLGSLFTRGQILEIKKVQSAKDPTALLFSEPKMLNILLYSSVYEGS